MQVVYFSGSLADFGLPLSNENGAKYRLPYGVPNKGLDLARKSTWRRYKVYVEERGRKKLIASEYMAMLARFLVNSSLAHYRISLV